MALNNRLVSELIRQRMGWKDDQNAARVINLVPEALKQFGRQYASDPFTRPLVTTPKATTTIAIGARGQVNLVTGYDTYQFLLEYLDKGLMYFLPGVTTTPYVLSGGTYASGYWTFNANPQHNETIAVNGVTITFRYTPVVVASAGGAVFNGTYTYVGQLNDKPYYSYSPGDVYYIKYVDSFWRIYNDEDVAVYASEFETNVNFPWEVTSWETVGPGVAPAPTVTEGALTSAEVEVGTTITTTALNFADALNASVNASITVATYAAGDPRNVVTGTYDTLGTGGNSFTLANSSFGSVARSGATFTGGAATAYALSIGAFADYFADLSRVRFTTTVTLPTGISTSTDYYLTNYTVDDVTNKRSVATFSLSSTADGLTPVVISSAGSGVLTMALQESNNALPLQLVSPKQAPLTQYLGDVFDYCYVQGNLLNLLPIDDVYPTGSVAFACPSFPANLADLPDSDEAEREFLQILTNMVSLAVMPV